MEDTTLYISKDLYYEIISENPFRAFVIGEILPVMKRAKTHILSILIKTENNPEVLMFREKSVVFDEKWQLNEAITFKKPHIINIVNNEKYRNLISLIKKDETEHQFGLNYCRRGNKNGYDLAIQIYELIYLTIDDVSSSEDIKNEILNIYLVLGVIIKSFLLETINQKQKNKIKELEKLNKNKKEG